MYIKMENGQVYETTSPCAYGKYEKMTVAAGKAAVKAQAIANLLEFLKPGQKVFCNLRSVSASGMSRRISFHIIEGDDLRGLDYLIARACDYKQSDKGGLIVSGCGMDMGFSVVYNLGAVIWPNGTPQPHGSRNGQPDSAGGYALKSDWV